VPEETPGDVRKAEFVCHRLDTPLQKSLVPDRTGLPGLALHTVTGAIKEAHSEDDAPILEITPGMRILAKLQTEISSADPTPVVAVVEYTYAIGDQVVVPAGAQISGQLQYVDRSGYVGVKFDEIQLLGGRTEKIGAVGKGLDLGPIRGTVTGKNTGKNFLVRTASGISSVAAMLVGNNTSSSFSEDDLLRERVAQNIGNTGDSELLSLNANSRVVVSVPADTKIYRLHEARAESVHPAQGVVRYAVISSRNHSRALAFGPGLFIACRILPTDNRSRFNGMS
jgi:hypothetical protein